MKSKVLWTLVIAVCCLQVLHLSGVLHAPEKSAEPTSSAVSTPQPEALSAEAASEHTQAIAEIRHDLASVLSKVQLLEAQLLELQATRRTIDLFQSAQLEYLLDTAEVLENWMFFADATARERQEMQTDLDTAIVKREQSKSRYEEVYETLHRITNDLYANDRGIAFAPSTPTPTNNL